jgi:hypothetical protein
MLEGCLYERYYGLPYARVRELDGMKSWDIRRLVSAPSSPAFAALCVELAAPASQSKKASFVARNGTVIEQEQILTTHNLAVLFDALQLATKLPLDELARECFAWVCHQHQLGIKQRRAQLQMLKNTAYAWRQMLFFLSRADSSLRDAFVPWSQEHLAKQGGAFRERFAPAARGLWHVMAGGRFDESGRVATDEGEGRRLLGWTTEPHWLMG